VVENKTTSVQASVVTSKPTNGKTNTGAKEHISQAITVLHPSLTLLNVLLRAQYLQVVLIPYLSL
jgi:hypothetical protein